MVVVSPPKRTKRSSFTWGELFEILSLCRDIMPGLLFGLEQNFFHDRLCGDTGVIRTRNPQSVFSALTMPSGQRVLDSSGDGVAEMER